MAAHKDKIEEYTEAEFLKFVEDICFVNVESEDIHQQWVAHFKRVSEHPRGSSVIYYPENEQDSSPAGIVKVIKEWRAANGKPGFKLP
jgi:hypothetical protein